MFKKRKMSNNNLIGFVSRRMQVARRFLTAVKECSDLKMAVFISCDAADVMRQAEDSTRRYQQGTSLIQQLVVIVLLNGSITVENHGNAGSGSTLLTSASSASITVLP